MFNTSTGKMRNRVTWYPSTETNTNGILATTYPSSGGDFWCMVTPTGGQETVVNNKVTASVMYTVTMRNIAAIKPKDKLVWGSINLQIEAIVNTNARNRELVITCKEII